MMFIIIIFPALAVLTLLTRLANVLPPQLSDAFGASGVLPISNSLLLLGAQPGSEQFTAAQVFSQHS